MLTSDMTIDIYVPDFTILRTAATNQYHKLINRAKKINAQLIQSSIPNPRLLWKKKLLTTS